MDNERKLLEEQLKGVVGGDALDDFSSFWNVWVWQSASSRKGLIQIPARFAMLKSFRVRRNVLLKIF